MPGGVSRWNAGKDLTWEPLRAELVAEVRYEHVLSGRFRHGGRLVRFRPDRTPDSCTYAQLDEVAPAELADIFLYAADGRGAVEGLVGVLDVGVPEQEAVDAELRRPRICSRTSCSP